MVAVKVVDLTKPHAAQSVLNANFNPPPTDSHHIIDGPDFGHWLKQFNPADVTTVTFNSLFDNSILAWRYGFVPHTMLDAMGMARALLGHELSSFSLKAIADYMHLGAKEQRCSI